MPAKFYNPYHFVPLEKRNAAQKGHSLKAEEVGKREGETKRPWVTHDRYVPGTSSGRIVYRVTTVTPTVVGAARTEGTKERYGRVEPYLAGTRAALPGSSLRGMVGAVLEAGTNGALRVLADRVFSYRYKMEDALSAIGMIVAGTDGELRLQPLCLPTLTSADGGSTFQAPSKFKRLFPTPQMKVLFGGYDEIRSSTFAYRTGMRWTDTVDYPVKQLAWRGETVVMDTTLHVKASRFAISQIASNSDAPRPGLVRVLGCWGDRRDEMPTTKKHELWIPTANKSAASCPILPLARERFEQLADERSDADGSLPFHPLETRNPAQADKSQYPLRLRVGDLVYFDVTERGEVSRVSYSAIWRGRVEDGSTGAGMYAFIRKVDSELLPLVPERQELGIAEQMLGFAEDQKTVTEGRPALTMASRLEFSDAVLPSTAADPLSKELVTLKILATPKMPSPALYFRGADGQGRYISKRELAPGKHTVQGRKWYVSTQVEVGQAPWQTETPEFGDKAKKQKNQVRPIAAGSEFFGHIDFDNLAPEEFGLLLWALEPSGAFHHRLGMGKPLGLGTVKVEVLGLFLVSRQERYTAAGFRAGRYGTAVLTSAGVAARGNAIWRERYGEELGAAGEGAAKLGEWKEVALGSGLLSESAVYALELLGNYGKAPRAGYVHYPTNANQKSKEGEHYKWFVFNDGQKERGQGMSPRGQFLAPIGRSKTIPQLEELEMDGLGGR